MLICLSGSVIQDYGYADPGPKEITRGSESERDIFTDSQVHNDGPGTVTFKAGIFNTLLGTVTSR